MPRNYMYIMSVVERTRYMQKLCDNHYNNSIVVIVVENTIMQHGKVWFIEMFNYLSSIVNISA